MITITRITTATIILIDAARTVMAHRFGLAH